MSDPPAEPDPLPGRTPPYGTNQRIRTRAIWAVAFFASSVPPAIIGVGITAATKAQINVATPIAFGFWAFGMLWAMSAALPTLRYWEALPASIRWLGALPLLSVSLFLSVALVTVTFLA